MTEKTLKEKLAKYLKLKEEVEKLEMEMKKIKKSIEPFITEPVKIPYKEKFISVKWIEKTNENIDKKTLKEKYAKIFNELVKYYQVRYIDIRLTKK